MSQDKADSGDEAREKAFREAAAKIHAVEQETGRGKHRQMPGKYGLLLLVTIALLAAGWAHTFHEMWYRWFEAWHHTDWPIMDRLTKGDSYYTHGPIVPLISLFAAIFLIYKRVGVPIARTRGSDLAGWVIMGAALLMQLFAARADVTFISGFALLGVMAGLVLLWGGWSLARAYWLPVVILVFMVPLPMDAIAKLNFQLKYFASEQAIWFTNDVFGIPAIMEGAYVFLEPEPDGTQKVLVVENVCGGLRSMISLVFFASLFAAMCRVKGVWRWFMLVLAVPVAIASNIARITSLNVVAHYYGVAAAGEKSGFHSFSGIMVFLVALAILFGIEQLIIHLGRWMKRDWTDQRLLGFLEHVTSTGSTRPRMERPVAFGCLALTAAVSVYWSWVDDPRINISDRAAAAVPQTAVIDGHHFDSRRFELDELVLTILQTNDYVYRNFFTDDRQFDVLLVFSPNNRKGTHPPEVCLEGSGWHIVSKQSMGIEILPGRTLTMRELIVHHGPRRNYHLYVYKCGDHYTHSYIVQQLLIFVNGLVDRNSAGALIRFDVPIVEHDVESARQTARAAVAALMPGIDQNLP